VCLVMSKRASRIEDSIDIEKTFTILRKLTRVISKGSFSIYTHFTLFTVLAPTRKNYARPVAYIQCCIVAFLKSHRPIT
jgi:hypothetical protein